MIRGQVPSEVWNRLGTKILPKLRSGTEVRIGIDFSVTASKEVAKSLETKLRLILDDLGLGNVKIEE